MNPLLCLKNYGQSVWYDNLDRSMLHNGTLARMIGEDGLCGLTSNPTIFEKAITGSSDYDTSLKSVLKTTDGVNARELFFHVATEDIQAAADLLRPVYDASGGHDGMVSLEVSPDLAYDTQATVVEAEQLHRRVSRPNLMVKVPGTRSGVAAFETLISQGLNINVTLLFSVERYKEIVEAHFLGLETRLRRGLPLSGIASVASFFVSRVDTAVDKLLEKCTGPHRALAQSLRGKIAIANAKLAYHWYQRVYSSPRFDVLRQAGAQPQRLLWASTGTKNSAYSDVLYVEALIGADTVNTMPPATYAAYKDHGRPEANTLIQGWETAQQQIKALPELGIDLAAVTEQLEKEGVQSFSKSFTALLNALNAKAQTLVGRRATA